MSRGVFCESGISHIGKYSYFVICVRCSSSSSQACIYRYRAVYHMQSFVERQLLLDWRSSGAQNHCSYELLHVACVSLS